MAATKRDFFPKYNQLKWYEKTVLNYCCYFPPKPRRIRGEINIDIEKYENTFVKAFNLNSLNDLNGMKILDFGCGEGGFSVALGSKLKNSKITGIDLLDGLSSANDIKNEKKLDNLNFIVDQSESLNDNSFDCVFSHDSFEHFQDPKYILSEMIRITKPNGSILIKFGPTWAGPYGRHMGGTFRKDWPWIHLLIPEKIMMRVHSVYHNRSELYEKYADLEGGLNKMTVRKALKIFKQFQNIHIADRKISYLWKGRIFKNIPFLNEMFFSSLFIKLKVDKVS